MKNKDVDTEGNISNWYYYSNTKDVDKISCGIAVIAFLRGSILEIYTDFHDGSGFDHINGHNFNDLLINSINNGAGTITVLSSNKEIHFIVLMIHYMMKIPKLFGNMKTRSILMDSLH